jgi:hypothetical protein
MHNITVDEPAAAASGRISSWGRSSPALSEVEGQVGMTIAPVET